MHRDNYNHFRGQMIAEDPFEKIGTQPVSIYHRFYVPNDPPGEYYLENFAHYEGIILSIHFFTDSWGTIEGSAAMVGPGIAITALHVISEYKQQIIAGALQVLCAGYTPEGFHLWRVSRVTEILESDTAILTLKFASALPTDNKVSSAWLSAALPQQGETVMICGFQFANDIVADDGEKAFPVKNLEFKYGARLLVRVGRVTQLYLSGRWPLVGPTIEVDCACPGGMSGGPAFNEKGRLIGILSRSMQSDDASYSLVALHWPALIKKIEPSFLRSILPTRFCLLELDQDFCAIDDRERLTRVIDPLTGAEGVSWKA